MQLRLPLHDSTPPTMPVDPASLVGGGASVETEVGRLQAELARAAAEQAKWAERRAKCSKNIRKLRDRIESLSFQIDSLQRNPLAIGRYRSTVPQAIVSTRWFDKPTSELKLETLSGVGTKRLRLLYERCPTIGDVEVMRVYEGLTTIPGLSRLTVARVEKRLFAWLRRNAWDYEPMPSYECRAERTGEEWPRVI